MERSDSTAPPTPVLTCWKEPFASDTFTGPSMVETTGDQGVPSQVSETLASPFPFCSTLG